MNKQNGKWHQLTLQAVQEQLHTNASCGLSRKEARSRYRRIGANTLFDTPQAKSSAILRTILTDPSLILLFFLCVFSICFLELAAGITAAVCLFLGLLYALRLHVIEKKLRNDLSAYRIPTVCVIRDGKRYITSARNIVVGDLLILGRGDLVPCDCRLITANDLRVLTLFPDDSHKLKYAFLPRNADACYPYGSTVSAPMVENMLYGGSEIVSGSAVAFAVETGARTFLGAMDHFTIPAESVSSREQHPGEGVIPYLKLYAFAMFLLLIPLALIGLLTAPADLGILEVFLSLGALIGSSSISYLLLHFRAVFTHTELNTMRREPKESRAILKSSRAMTRLSSVTDLFVLGHCGISDGRLHLSRVWLGSGEVDLKEAVDPQALTAISEAVCLYGMARTHLPMADGELGNDTLWTDELLQISEYDREALEMRARTVTFRTYATDHALLEVTFPSSTERYFFTDDPNRISQCTYYWNHGKSLYLDPSVRRELLREVREAVNEGCGIHTVVRYLDSGELCLVGILAVQEAYQATLPSVLEELRQSGVRVTFFLRGNETDERRYLNGCPSAFSESTAFLTDGNRQEIVRLFADHRVLVGCTDSEVASLIKLLKKDGKNVAVFGIETEDLALMRRAFLAITADPLPYHQRAYRENLFDPLTVGDPLKGESTPQAIRRYADVLIDRADSYGGGLFTILQSVTDCRASSLKMHLILRFLFLSAMTRLVSVILPLFFGRGLMSGAQILYSGLLIETLGVCSLLAVSVPQNRLRRQLRFSSQQIGARLFGHEVWLPPLIASAVTVLFVTVLSFCGVFAPSVCAPYLFFSMLLLQLTEWIDTARPLLRREILKTLFLPLLLLIVPTVIFAVLSYCFPLLNIIFGLGCWHPITLSALPLSPILYILCRKLFSKK